MLDDINWLLFFSSHFGVLNNTFNTHEGTVKLYDIITMIMIQTNEMMVMMFLVEVMIAGG